MYRQSNTLQDDVICLWFSYYTHCLSLFKCSQCRKIDAQPTFLPPILLLRSYSISFQYGKTLYGSQKLTVLWDNWKRPKM